MPDIHKIIEDVQMLQDTMPERESTEFDMGMKRMKQRVLTLLETYYK